MNPSFDSLIHPLFLNFKSKQTEISYGEWGIERLKTTYYGALVGAGFLSLVILLLNSLVLGRLEMLLVWINLVIPLCLSTFFILVVRHSNVTNRSQLDFWGALFVGLGQIGQFIAAFSYPELGGQYLFANVVLATMGNSSFSSLNFRYIVPIVLAVQVVFLVKIFVFDQMEVAQLAYQATMAVVFTSIGLTAGYVIERSSRMNFFIQQSLERQQMELLNKNKELEQFAYIASHDLQEPLRSVTSFSQLLEEEYHEQLGPEGGQYLKYLIEASARMRNLIKGLLDYSRLGREAQLVKIDVAETLRAILVDLSQAVSESKASISFGPMPVIEGYETEFRQLLQNLLSNAIKFRRAEIVPEVIISSQKRGAFWEFSVKDNGIGIEPEYHEKIFLIFQRLHNRSLYEGTGIGLANCRKIVELHGGTIRLESAHGLGSNFIFTIPIR